MVEFALIAPAFFAILFMVLQAGLYINAVDTVNNADREGARVAAMCGGSISPPLYYNGSDESSCTAAIYDAVRYHMGFLHVITPNVNPNVTECTLSSPPPASAPCGTSTYAPTQGTLIQVSVDYTYDFYFGVLLGNTSPFTTDIGSDAVVVSQQ